MPKMRDTKPLQVHETPGTKYYCTCGNTENYPYCDGSHEGTDNEPAVLEVEEEKDVYICQCGKSENFPYCDGSHEGV